MEHLEHFGLARDPFRNEVDLDFWFPSRSHVEVGRRLRRCVEQGKELCVLVGEVGSGTTTLARALVEQLDPEAYEAALLVLPRGVEPDALRGAIARQLGVEAPSDARSEALRELYQRLVALREAGRRAVVVVDEAQSASPEALAEVRALSNLEHDDGRMLTFVLVGSPFLESALARDPDLVARIELRLRLEPLSPSDAAEYLAHRLEIAGGDRALLGDEVAAAIATRAGGLPRRLNALADGTLYEAHLAGHAQPTRIDVERAARDLPWTDGGGASASFSHAAAVAALPEKEDDGLGLDDVYEAPPAIESLRDAGASASFPDLDLPDLEAGLEARGPNDLGAGPGASRDGHGTTGARIGLGRTVREEEVAADLIGPDHTAPGAWRTAAPVDDDEITASRKPAPAVRPLEEASLLPDPDEIDGLFVDLVEEIGPDD